MKTAAVTSEVRKFAVISCGVSCQLSSNIIWGFPVLDLVLTAAFLQLPRDMLSSEAPAVESRAESRAVNEAVTGFRVLEQ